jgi:hypothetical protein
MNKFILYIDNILEKITRPIYVSLMIILYCFYFVIIFGIFYINAAYLRTLVVAIQVFIAVILIIRFNPFRHHTLHASDSDIIFASATFLLFNALLTEGVIGDIKNWINVA